MYCHDSCIRRHAVEEILEIKHTTHRLSSYEDNNDEFRNDIDKNIDPGILRNVNISNQSFNN
jgi:hypothetical protein